MARKFEQSVDSTDPRYVLIETSVPNGGMPEADYRGADALDRLERFARTYITGYLAGGEQPPVPPSTDDPVYIEDAVLEEGYRFRQQPSGDAVALQIRIPRAKLRAPKSWNGQRAVDRLWAFLNQWLTERDATRSPEQIATWLIGGASGAGPVSKEVVARGWRFKLIAVGAARRFEAQLYRRNRTLFSDWQTLGAVTCAVGAPKDPIVPIDKLAPTDTFAWEWTE